MSGGVLDADNSSTLSGTLTHSGDITIDVADNKTLTYSGAAISVGANTLTLSGGGSLVSGGLTLNDASSKLLLSSITVDNVSTSANSLGLDVDNNSTDDELYDLLCYSNSSFHCIRQDLIWSNYCNSRIHKVG